MKMCKNEKNNVFLKYKRFGSMCISGTSAMTYNDMLNYLVT